MKSDCALFSSLYIFCQTRDGDLDEFFKREKDEMEAYLGVCVTMGINNSPKLADDWSSDIFMIHNDGIKQTMSKNRFEEISQFFHLNIIREKNLHAARKILIGCTNAVPLLPQY